MSTKQIRRFPIYLQSEQIVLMPKNCDIVSVKSQQDNIALFTLVNPNEDKLEEIEVKLYSDEENINIDVSKYRYLDSVLLRAGCVTYHVFIRYVSNNNGVSNSSEKINTNIYTTETKKGLLSSLLS
ncbi:putative portal protein [Bacillus phage vB_BspM_Internexus]|nr:putative portal protein [Bacillus phage vB_BspM_Internexus]